MFTTLCLLRHTFSYLRFFANQRLYTACHAYIVLRVSEMSMAGKIYISIVCQCCIGIIIMLSVLVEYNLKTSNIKNVFFWNANRRALFNQTCWEYLFA